MVSDNWDSTYFSVRIIWYLAVHMFNEPLEHSIVGDGAFQMTGMEISSAVRYKLNPIVIVLNNGGYGTEPRLLDGPFNDLQPWQYRNIPEIVGGGRGFVVKTEDEFDKALEAANQYLAGFCILDIRLDSNDGSAALQRLTDILGERVR